MDAKSTILRSGVGRRIFLLYLASALLPVVTLVFVSYRSVTQNLLEQSEERLRSLTKTYVMEIWERLAFLDTELQIVSTELKLSPAPPFPTLLDLLGEDLTHRFRGVIWVRPGYPNMEIHGTSRKIPKIDPESDQHLADGRPLLVIRENAEGKPQVWLARRVDSLDVSRGTLWSDVDPPYAWWGATFSTTLPPLHEMSVIDLNANKLIYSTLSPETTVSMLEDKDILKDSLGGFDWDNDGENYGASYRMVNLRPVFFHPGLTLVMSQSKKAMLLPLADFKRNFIAVVLLAFWAVVLLSIRSIRSSLTPLEKLRKGTQRIASGELDVQLEIDTNDEFEHLAESFNKMSRGLTRQFSTLSTLNTLQQAILSSQKTEEILAPVLRGFPDVFPCQEVNISVIYPKLDGAGRRFSRVLELDGSLESEAIEVSAIESAELEANPRVLHLDSSWQRLSFFRARPGTSVDRLLVMPGYINDELAVVVAAGISNHDEYQKEDVDRARQLTDQVTVALSNSRLIQELDDLSWGTLSALARAIDVRSHWTMGHTERVSSLAQQIGRAIGLSRQRLQTLHRGSLLHDIGKIGIPSSILDKSSKLTADEMDQIHQHVQHGVRIIEPIAGLQDARQVVHEHHEWWDGNGYPRGLSGKEICLEARILTIADCYDALRSARPYRPAVGHQEVLDYIRDGAGKQFDPEVVEVFFRVVAPEMTTSETLATEEYLPAQHGSFG